MKSKQEVNENEWRKMLFDDFYGDETTFWKELKRRKGEKK